MLDGFHFAIQRMRLILGQVLETKSIDKMYKDECTPSFLEKNSSFDHLKFALYYIAEKMHRAFDTLEAERQTVLEVMQWVLDQRILTFDELKNRPRTFFEKLELIAFAGGNSLGTALGVQIILAGGSVMNLAHPKLAAQLLPDLESGAKKICFAMTELGHGTNVKGIESVAFYDVEQDEFVIHNAHSMMATKWFIGSAKYADYAVVFAQLMLPNQSGDLEKKGPHAILVSLRNPDGTLRSGIEINDLGHKMGTNGVANCTMQFDTIRAPRRHLMMQNIVRLRRVKEGDAWKIVYEKRAAFPLVSLYSTLKYGRTLIGKTSLGIQKMMLILAEELRLKRLHSILRPNSDFMVQKLSQIFGLEYALKQILADMKGKSDTLVTGIKVLSNEYCEQMMNEMINYYLSCAPTIKMNLMREKANWVVGRTYEGDDAVIPQKVMGDKVLALIGLVQRKQYWDGFCELFHISRLYLSEKFSNKTPLLYLELLAYQTMFEVMRVLNDQTDLTPQAERWNRMQMLITELGMLFTQIEVLHCIRTKVNSEGNHEYLDWFGALYVVYESRVVIENASRVAQHLPTLASLEASPAEIDKRMEAVRPYLPSEEVFIAQRAKQKEAILTLTPHLTDMMEAFTKAQGGENLIRFMKERLYKSPKRVQISEEPQSASISWSVLDRASEDQKAFEVELTQEFRVQSRL
ncbi:MAG: acyl-CoA dehydrogenase family protein [Gammaproteobacteria bacterium]